MTYLDKLPFTDIVQKQKHITSASNDTMITRVPWQPGAQKYYTVRKVVATAISGAGISTLTLWDKDLSSTTPAVRGDASNGSLITLILNPNVSSVSNTMLISETQMPPVRFEAGITAQHTGLNAHVILELELH
jgi:hypothetical protein